MDWRSVKLRRTLLASILLLFFLPKASALTVRDYAIEVSATVQESPPQIRLRWLPTGDWQSVQISRKFKHETSWTPIAVVPSSSTEYVDTNVGVGIGYEYAFTKGSQLNFVPAGYIYAGIKLPLVENRGKCLLIVENTYAGDLSFELARLQQDLMADGWTVLRRDVSRFDSPSAVRWQIQVEKNSHPDLRTVFLFGRVPVAYSGNYEADDHPEHKGAWAADTFYAELDGNWTDSVVNNTSAVRPANRNTPGDGKYDQSSLPSDVDVELGRVDLANMGLFQPKTERDLLRQYLNKNHNFRRGNLSVERRGIIFDGFGESDGEAFGAGGWRNFATFFGSANVFEIGENQFFPTTAQYSCLWSCMNGGGGDDYQTCYFVATSSQFVNNDPKVVFTTFFGSYFGDWDHNNNLLRAPLCTPGYTLTVAWAGRPHWFFHHMALGETIGYATRLSQNNSGLYRPNQYTRLVHTALIGDPTLRMHPVRPVSNLSASSSPGTVTLQWSASADSGIVGYHIYRAPSQNGPFTRITSNPVGGTSYSDSPASGTYTYMVKAIKLESSASGTYYNSSLGVFVTATVSAPIPTTPVNITNVRLSGNLIAFRCNGQSGQTFRIERSNDFGLWTPIFTNTLSGNSYEFSETRQSGPRFYRTRLMQ